MEYTVNGTRWPDWTFITQAESAAQALAAAPDHLRELGGDYEKLPQLQAEGTVLTVAYRTKVRLASALVVKSDYYNGDGALAGTVVQEYEAPAGERAVIDYLEGSLEGIEYIPVRLVLQATPFYLIYFLLLTEKQRKQAISKNFLRFDCFYGIPCLC